MKKVSKTKLIDLLVNLNKIDKQLYTLLNPHKRYPEQDAGWFFLDFYNVLNAIYYEFCGESEKLYYQKFKTTNYDHGDKPVAWYETDYSSEKDSSIKGPKGLGGFIPDRINDTILRYDLKPKEKLKLLNRMFKDLKKLEQEYDKKTKNS